MKKNRYKYFKSLVFGILLAVSGLSQTRPLPIQNGYLRNDLNANTNSITNLHSVVFSGDGTNLVIDASVFLSLFEGVSKKLINRDENTEFLIVSNARPYMITSNGIREVTLQNDTSFIRQHEPQAFVSNLTVYSTLWLESDTGLESNVYSVTFPSLTNGNIQALKTGNITIQNRDFKWNDVLNFTWSNTVPANITVTNDAYTSTMDFTINEWNYLVENNGKFKSGKIYFSVYDTVSGGSVLIGNSAFEESFSTDTEMIDYSIEVICEGHKARLVTTGAGFWYLYGSSHGISK